MNYNPNPQQPVQPTQATPMQQPAPSQPAPVTGGEKKKLPKWAKILIIVGSLAVLAGVVMVIVVSMLKDNDSEVQGFLGAIYASDYSAAYDYFSPQLKDVQAQDTFESQVRTLTAAGVDSSCSADWTTNSVSSSTSTGNTKELAGTLDCDKGSFSANFNLVEQSDGYKLYVYSIQPK